MLESILFLISNNGSFNSSCNELAFTFAAFDKLLNLFIVSFNFIFASLCEISFVSFPVVKPDIILAFEP